MDAISQLLTTFDTPWGWYCFLKLPFGLGESQYFFQFYVDLNFKLYVLIVENADSNPTDSHDQCLIQVLNKCHEVGLKLKSDKCIFKMMQVLFYGHLVINIGLKPDPSKITAIGNMPAPQNKIQLQSFIGLCNYVLHLTDVLPPLRELTVKSIEFEWK